MISPELIRRYSFFSGLDYEYIVTLAKASQEIEVQPGYCFFKEGEELNKFYLVVEGSVGIFVDVLDRDNPQKLSDQLTGNCVTKELLLSRVGPGNIFAWSALISPHFTTAGAKALTDSRVFAFDCQQLREDMRNNPQFSVMMVEKAAQTIRERLRDLRIEYLAELAS